MSLGGVLEKLDPARDCLVNVNALGDPVPSARFMGGREFSMVGNDLANADENRDDGHGIGRFFVAQGHAGSMENMYWGDNVSHQAAPHNCNKVDCNKWCKCRCT